MNRVQAGEEGGKGFLIGENWEKQQRCREINVHSMAGGVRGRDMSTVRLWEKGSHCKSGNREMTRQRGALGRVI